MTKSKDKRSPRQKGLRHKSELGRKTAIQYKRSVEKREHRRKYNTRNTKVFNGHKFDSCLECDTAMWLDDLKSQGLIAEVEYHYSIEFKLNGSLICKHEVDFRVTMNNGDIKFVETKGRGYDGEVWRLKKKMTEAQYRDIPYLVDHSDRQLKEKELLR